MPRAGSAKGQPIPRKRQKKALRGNPRPKPPNDRGAKSSYKCAGRWLDKPKAEHEIVRRAVEIANRAFQRVVTVEEVLKAMTPGEVKTLETTYAMRLSTTVSVVLNLLLARGCVFSPGKSGKRRYYGAAGVIDPASPLPAAEESRRQRVLGLVRYTVEKLGRAVRMSDILEEAAEFRGTSNLLLTDISHDVLSLKHEGELRLVGSIRGDGKGFNLYLPAELNAEDYASPDCLTWLQAVALTFFEMWEERVDKAASDGVKPHPLSTGEIRTRLRASSQYAERYSDNLADPMVLVNAMQQLAGSSNPVVRKIRRPGQKAILWAPLGMKDEDLDIDDAYASDLERVAEAVRRAEDALNRPVCIRDVKDQIDLDTSLQPVGSSTVFSILAEASKSGEPRRWRCRRVTQRIHRVGKIADDTYYSIRRTPEAESFVELGRLELRWEAMRAEEQIDTLDICSLPCVATGRVLLIATELAGIMDDLNRLREGGYLRGESLRKADDLHKHISVVRDITHTLIARHSSDDPRLPQQVNTYVPGWTADELLEVIKPLYPRSQKLKKGSKLLPLMGNAIRRVPNPEYVRRFSKDQRLASEYLYDRTDALIYIAKEWGGYECCLQATLAGNELSRLRDSRFVLPALDDKDFNARLAAVACLAFLQSEAGNERLRNIAKNDLDPGVRQSALWAYGFAGEKDARTLLESRSRHDPDPRVRSFAQQILLNSEESWWAF